MEIFNEKSNKRGRPRKLVKLDDGTIVAYKDYLKDQKAQTAKVVAPVPA